MSIEKLAARAGVRVRTVRFYIAEGLLAGPGARGRGAGYSEEHLLRLRLIRRLAERHVPLAEMRARLAYLSLEQVRALLTEEDRRAAHLDAASKAESASEYLEALLRREPARMAEAPVPPVAAVASPPAASLAPPASPPGALWRRWELAPGVELHVRDDAHRQHADLIAHLRTQIAAEVALQPCDPERATNNGRLGNQSGDREPNDHGNP
jgi:DNA-binding transcriptional MerR regulator